MAKRNEEYNRRTSSEACGYTCESGQTEISNKEMNSLRVQYQVEKPLGDEKITNSLSLTCLKPSKSRKIMGIEKA